MLKISNLSVYTKEKEILKDFNIEIKPGQVHAIMGPNGIGKSTICKTIMGDPNYIVSEGSITYKGEDILKMNVTQRANSGIFLLNQSPIEVPGVSNAEMLRQSLNEKNSEKISLYEFNQKMIETCKLLELPNSFIHRGINEKMSGGERKKCELLHMWILNPSFIILDELDSGLDVDSLNIVVKNINLYLEKYPTTSILLITHHTPLLNMLKIDKVHIIKNGTIIKSGDVSLANQIELEGYKNI